MGNSIDIALASNERYLPGLATTLVSIVAHASDKDRLRFHILDDGLSEDSRQYLRDLARQFGLRRELEFKTLDMSVFKSNFDAYKGSHTAYMRLGIYTILDCDWVLYSDVDVLWLRDVCELWEQRDDRYPIAWCRDIPTICYGVKQYSKWNPDFDETRYACSGVCLMNLNRMREFDLLGKSREFVRQWGTPFLVDQDILNYFFMKDALMLDCIWDVTVPDRRVGREGGVIHCCGVGQHFHSGVIGCRPLFAIWQLYYHRIILGDDTYRIPLSRRILFAMLSLLFPFRAAARLFLSGTNQRLSEIQRTLFYSWLLQQRNFDFRRSAAN